MLPSPMSFFDLSHVVYTSCADQDVDAYTVLVLFISISETRACNIGNPKFKNLTKKLRYIILYKSWKNWIFILKISK